MKDSQYEEYEKNSRKGQKENNLSWYAVFLLENSLLDNDDWVWGLNHDLLF